MHSITTLVRRTLQRLQHQHMKDLTIYRACHKDFRNRALHWMMIPTECWSALLILTVVFPSWIGVGAGVVLGCLSLGIATKPAIGFLSFLFHLAAIWSCAAMMTTWGRQVAFTVALMAWNIAWLLQVCVGHWMLEGNQPNVSNLKTVSFLAMIQSVLIAWSS